MVNLSRLAVLDSLYRNSDSILPPVLTCRSVRYKDGLSHAFQAQSLSVRSRVLAGKLSKELQDTSGTALLMAMVTTALLEQHQNAAARNEVLLSSSTTPSASCLSSLYS